MRFQIHHGVLASCSQTGVTGRDEPERPERGHELPEFLIHATVRAAVRIARDRTSPSQILSQRTTWLVGEALRALADDHW